MNRTVEGNREREDTWPSLPLAAWQDTYSTLHMWTQIVGKVRMRQCPFLNHWWHVTLYVTSRGLTTGPMPYGPLTFQIDFDFLSHKLVISTSQGWRHTIALAPRTVAAFYKEVMAALRSLDIDVTIWTMPQEVPDPIPFEQDDQHASYDPEYAQRCWRILVQVDRVCQQFRSRFLGKCSPVHFFWGSFDMAVTRFSGRRAPEHPGGGLLPTWITREAYSHEVSSCGWWPGSGPIPYPAFYAYAYPEPTGFREANIRPATAFYASDLGEYILPYDDVRQADDPDAVLLDFLQTTYEASANLAHWDRAALERAPAP
ncbi:MAG TPA: DUF5996 family protein [Chthonomonadaceae bacterium]|nr:DUF5996 family protein [Chthonomonadaceae bacterium]